MSTAWYGENTVYGMVSLRYGNMVRCRGCIVWLICLVVWYVSVYKARKEGSNTSYEYNL